MTLKEAGEKIAELEDKLLAAENRAADLDDQIDQIMEETGEKIAGLEAELKDAQERLATLGDQAAKELAEVVDTGIPEDAVLSVRAINPKGFSRCGRRWGAKEQFVRHGEFSLADLERLLAEPNLETRKLK